MMSEIEDEVMVKPINNSTHSKQPPTSQNSGLDFTLNQLVQAAPDIDKARVEFIKKEISSGRYKISSSLIAKRMLMG
ncbi:MAG: flagellar biosynthesis anti-sigma factor FlgM [Legionella sp.]|nr:flagellar biosynthesis anti-sigma factor FlgM [Legionella sp.]